MKAISKHSAAILVFAHSSKEELKHKNINKGELLFDALNGLTLKMVEETGVPFFHITEKHQDGLSFGERFSNAIQSIFDLGYERIITVGNDSPQLTKVHVADAIEALNSHQVVLGPSTDGGFYLMGLHQKDFEKAAFEKLSWQTSAIYKEVLTLFSADAAKCFQLPSLIDIDSYNDVLVIAKYARGLSHKIARVINSVLFSDKKIASPLFTVSNLAFYRIPSNKGSPVPSFS